MAYPLKIVFVFFYSFGLAVCGGRSEGAFEILRGQYDTFKNLNCQTECDSGQCQIYNAECVDSNCTRCRCPNGSNTFIKRGSNPWNCTEDEKIIQDSVPKNSFPLRYKQYEVCLTVDKNNSEKMFGRNCSDSSLYMRWMFIKELKQDHAQLRLVNIATHQCLEFMERKSDETRGYVTMKPCGEQKTQDILTGTGLIYNGGKFKERKYLTLLKRSNEHYLAASGEHSNDTTKRWHNMKDGFTKTIVKQYKGCYRFEDNGFMLYLDNTTCTGNVCSYNFSAPIFAENAECSVVPSASTWLRGADWQKVSKIINTNSLFSIENGTKSTVKILKIQKQALQNLDGELLKLGISCRNEKESQQENQCLLLKFKSLSIKKYQTTTTPITPHEQNTVITRKVGTIPKYTESTEKTQSRTTGRIQQKESQSSSINTLAIVVPICLLVVILALAFIYFLSYRKRKRAQKLPRDAGTEMNNPNYSKPVYEDPNRVYDMPGAAIPNDSASPARYEYIDNSEIAKPKQPQTELKYDYAANTDIPRIDLDALARAEGENRSGNLYSPEESKPQAGRVYATLEEPTDEFDPLVGYDTPHSEDPVYNVLEEPNK